MLTCVVMPQLVAVRPVGFRLTPYDWVPLAVIILLIVIFVVCVQQRRPVSGAECAPVRAADCAPCQSRARTRQEPPRTSRGIQTAIEPAVTRNAAVNRRP